MKLSDVFSDQDNDAIIGALSVLLTEREGFGACRTVYSVFGTDYVLKLEHHHQVTQNVLEMEMWHQWSETDEGRRWLVPCLDCSANGRALLQQKVKPVTDVNDPRLPKKIPRWMTDTKVTNWGVCADGEARLLDYGISLLMMGNPWQLVKPKWWSLDD